MKSCIFAPVHVYVKNYFSCQDDKWFPNPDRPFHINDFHLQLPISIPTRGCAAVPLIPSGSLTIPASFFCRLLHLHMPARPPHALLHILSRISLPPEQRHMLMSRQPAALPEREICIGKANAADFASCSRPSRPSETAGHRGSAHRRPLC